MSMDVAILQTMLRKAEMKLRRQEISVEESQKEVAQLKDLIAEASLPVVTEGTPELPFDKPTSEEKPTPAAKSRAR